MSYADKILAFCAFVTFIVYISLISTDRYINKSSPQWATTSLDDKRFVGYTNMVGNLFMIFICGFDGVVFTNAKKIYLNVYLAKLLILLIFIAYSYDVSLDNTPYSKFISALQPLVGYLQVLSVGTIVQIVTRIDKKLHKASGENMDDESYRNRGDSDLGRLLEKSDDE